MQRHCTGWEISMDIVVIAFMVVLAAALFLVPGRVRRARVRQEKLNSKRATERERYRRGKAADASAVGKMETSNKVAFGRRSIRHRSL